MSRSVPAAAVGLALALALVATACVGSSEDTDTGVAQAAGSSTVEVILTDFAIEPETVQAPSGQDLRFEIMNHGQAPHTYGVVVDGETVESAEIPAGGEGTLDVPALEPGSYDALCTVSGHDDLGMVGKVEAVAGGGDTDTAAGEDDEGSHATAHGMAASEMAAMHEEGVKDFLAGDQTDTIGGTPLEPRIEKGVEVWEMTVEEVEWEIAEGVTKQAMGFNGIVPGPELRVHPGDEVKLVFQNQTEQPTTVHFHGLTVPNSEDGVPYVTQPPIMPGEYWTYRFRIVDPPGMYVYHSHFNSTEQVGKGLYGAIIVEPRDGNWRPLYGAQPDAEYSIFLGDGPLDYVINGKSFPATAPMTADRGDHVLIHIANDGAQLHPMHLHGFHFDVVGEDGFPLPARNRYTLDTLVVAPGARYDIMVRATEPGAWAFHCHILPHVEGPEGMFGMVTALVVE